ncbi:MAG: PadR family transcriptional regulator [Acidobacteria bacterium]|nr:PadR family transcriptional regulator [Acidobacteriota bacterium]
MRSSDRSSIPQGTLDMLILQTVAAGGEMHGFAIADAILEQSGDVLQVEEGSLYPALQRLLVKGFLTGEWGKTPDNRRARYYRLTVPGRKQLGVELAEYRRVSGAILRIIQPA